MLVLEPIEFVPNPRNFLDFVKRRSGQLSGCRLDRPVALLVSIPQKEARSGIVEPLVRLAGPTISLRAFLEAAAQPGQNFRAQGSGLGEEPGRLPESAIQNLAFQPATKAIRARPPSRRCSRIDFHNNGGSSPASRRTAHTQTPWLSIMNGRSSSSKGSYPGHRSSGCAS
jgi:hypothetical protein